MIPLKISKEEINELALGQFEGEIFLIEDLDDVEEVADFLSQHSIIGFDTETKPAFKKRGDKSGIFTSIINSISGIFISNS